MIEALAPVVTSAFDLLAVFKPPPPPLPPPLPEGFSISPASLLVVVLCWGLPALLLLSQRSTKLSPVAKVAKDGNGKEVPKDIVRRQEALAEKKETLMDRVLAVGTWAGLTLPLVWVFETQ